MGCDCEKNKPNKEQEKIAGLDRRTFLSRMIVSLGALIGGLVSFPLLSAIVEPVVGNRKRVWRKIGSLSDFVEGETKKVKFKNASTYDWSERIQESGAYIRRNKANQLVAFRINCSHLGCPVRWQEKSQMFLCPCHGGAFFRDGSRAAGPPNRGLYTYPVRIRNGNVELQTDSVPITNIDV